MLYCSPLLNVSDIAKLLVSNILQKFEFQIINKLVNTFSQLILICMYFHFSAVHDCMMH